MQTIITDKEGLRKVIDTVNNFIDNCPCYIEYLNKEKGFKRDRIEFKNEAAAESWGKKNLEKFNPDMIRLIF